MAVDDEIDWNSTTWEGNRRAQLRASLKLTPKQRFEALEEMAETSRWLAGAGKRHAEKTPAVLEPVADYSKRRDGTSSSSEE